MLKDLVLKNRSYRRFDQGLPVNLQTLKELVELARICPSGANIQPIKYVLSSDRETNGKIFSRLAWAGYLKDWKGPMGSERPAAYVILLGDPALKKNFDFDGGIQAQTMLLGAAELGLGGCMVGSVDRNGLRQDLQIPEKYEIVLVIAVGKPGEKVILEDKKPEGDIKYYRDTNDVHHVPKRTLEELIVKTF